MSHLGVVEDTLFVPMLGRIYASEHCPQIIYDKKALELKEKLPPDLLGNGSQSQYTLLASAARTSLTTGGNCSQNRNGRPTLPEMPFPRTGSGKFARIFPMPLSLLPQADCFTILRKIRLFLCFVCSDNLEI